MDTIIWILIGIGAFVILMALVWFITKLSQRKPVEVVEEERYRPRKEEMVPFDEEVMEVLERRIIRCANCDEEVSPYDDVCPHCGARLSMNIYECSNCGKEVDPRDRECPHCGEILLPEPYVCPKCFKPVEADASKCDYCGATFWSPILLDEETLKRKKKHIESEESD